MANGIFVHDASAKHLNESSGFLMVAAERGGFCFFFFFWVRCGLDLHMAEKIALRKLLDSQNGGRANERAVERHTFQMGFVCRWWVGFGNGDSDLLGFTHLDFH